MSHREKPTGRQQVALMTGPRQRLGYCPEKRDVRAGVQTGEGVTHIPKEVPRAAMASRLGVLGLPGTIEPGDMNSISFMRSWSAVISSMFGYFIALSFKCSFMHGLRFYRVMSGNTSRAVFMCSK